MIETEASYERRKLLVEVVALLGCATRQINESLTNVDMTGVDSAVGMQQAHDDLTFALDCISKAYPDHVL